MAGYDDPRASGFFSNSDIETAPPLHGPRDVHSRRERGPAQRSLARAGRWRWARPRWPAPSSGRAGGGRTSTSSPPPPAPGGCARASTRRSSTSSALKSDHPARARGRHRLRQRDGGDAAGVQSPARVPRPPRGDGGGGDLLGGLLPRRPARERGGARDLRGRRGGHRDQPGRERDRRSSSTAPCSAPSTWGRWASSTRAAGRGWCSPRTCGASAPAMMKEMADALMAGNGLKTEDIAHFVLHSAGRRVIEQVAKLMTLDETRARPLAERAAAVRQHVVRHRGLRARRRCCGRASRCRATGDS